MGNKNFKCKKGVKGDISPYKTNKTTEIATGSIFKHFKIIIVINSSK